MKVQIFRTGGTHVLGEFNVTNGEPTPQVGDIVKVPLDGEEMDWQFGEVYQREWSVTKSGVQLNIRIEQWKILD